MRCRAAATQTLANAFGCRLFLIRMRTNINLSTRPFANRRIFWIVLVVVYLASFWTLLWMTDEKGRVLAKENDARQRIEGQRHAAEMAKSEKERRAREQQKVVINEQQAIQLASARQLIQRKAFAWNRMIGDIEDYVPKQTRIISIKVAEIINTGDDAIAKIEVKAAGATPSEMTEMMLNIEKSGGRFSVGETQQDATAENGETPFTLNLIYKPMRGAAK